MLTFIRRAPEVVKKVAGMPTWRWVKTGAAGLRGRSGYLVCEVGR
jgi:hypothetical protein